MLDMPDPKPLCLLALDGGGIRGLSELVILEEIMNRIKFDLNAEDDLLPADFFDLIGGTSTGGLIALLLGRLRLSVPHARREFLRISEKVFSMRRYLSQNKFDDRKLENEIKQLLGENHGDERMMGNDVNPSCKVFICAVPQGNVTDRTGPRLFRTYKVREGASYNCTIWEACRATSAAPTFFKPIKIGEERQQETFVDGGIGFNNPVEQVLEEASRIFRGRKVGCIVSIGTGVSAAVRFPDNPSLAPKKLVNALTGMITESDRMAETMSRRFENLVNTYFRFSVDRGLHDIGLEEWKELSPVHSFTTEYIGLQRITRQVNEVVKLLLASKAIGKSRPTPLTQLPECVSMEIGTSNGSRTLEWKPTETSLPRFSNTTERLASHIANPVPRSPDTPNRRKSHVFVPFTPGRYFMGRQDELEKLQHWLADDDEYRPQAVALYGAGGVGKTQLALKYATDHSHLYEWVFFANASSAEVLRNDFRKMHHQVCRSVEKDENFTERMLDWLASRDDRWLLILDNANHLQDVLPYMSRLVHIGQIIVTTQDQRVRENEFIRAALDVQSFSPKASKELLFARSGLDPFDKGEASAATALLKEIGHLPLAIDSAGAYMSVRRKSVTEYASLFYEYQRELLSQTRLPGSSYSESVAGALEVSFKEIDTRPDASALLCLLIFLNRAEVTEVFLKRGVTEQQSWGPNGEAMTVSPQDNYVPQALIDLINNPIRLGDALEDLTALSIISRDGKAFTLHPLYHKCAKLRMSENLRRKSCAEALMFLAHAFPADEYVLEKSDGELTRSFIPHIIYAYESFKHTDNDLSIDFLDSLASQHRFTGQLRPREVVAKLVLDGDLTYGQGEPKKNAHLLAWVYSLLKTSSNIYLQARALSVQLGITYYESGNYVGGITACERFLDSVKRSMETGQTTINELSNAEIGILQSTLAELFVTEVGSHSEQFVRSKALLQSWSPLNPNAPSRKEKFSLGAQARILSKVLKDHGEWAASETQFRVYLDTYAPKGTQAEGWSAGDLAHTLMEQGRAKEAEDILRKYLKPRQVSLTSGMRTLDRRSDTMYLKMLLGESLRLQSKYNESEDSMQRLLDHFFGFEGDLWHFEKFRVAFVMTVLARIHHLQGHYDAAIKRWKQMIDYCESEINVDEQRGKWGRDSFMPLIAELSLSDCYFKLGKEDIAMPHRTHSLGLLENTDGQLWILGLGTYWLDMLRTEVMKGS